MKSSEEKKAVVLLSGGLDSATTLAIAVERGYLCHALSFDYGQKHEVELESAAVIADSLGAVDHRTVRLDLSEKNGFGCSVLTGPGAVPVEGRCKGIPSTYVPARNTIFLAVALGYAEVLGAFDIFIGVNAVDYSGYPDCRPEYIECWQRLANLATAAAVEGQGEFRILAPLMELGKVDIIREGLRLGVDYSLTSSCYDPDTSGRACGRCDACRLRLAGFRAAAEEDPAEYRFFPPDTKV